MTCGHDLRRQYAPAQKLRTLCAMVAPQREALPRADATKWSAGLAAAVMCQDPPQIFDMRLAPALRLADRDRAIARRKATLPDTYAPFSIDEYRGMPLDYSFIDQCVEWPVAPPTHSASHVVASDSRYPDIPALIVSGELDNMTTPADGAAVARAFKRGRQIRIANSFHVNALPHSRSACGAQIVRHFIETLDLGNTSCAADVPPLRLVPRFALHAADAEPATAADGNRAGAAQLRWAQAAAQTAGDVLARLGGNSTGAGVGLRGGNFRIVNDHSVIHISLDQIRWTEDLAVSGRIDKPAARTGTVHAALHVTAPQGAAGDLTVDWPEGVTDAIASIRGRLGGINVVAVAPAP
jgi:TAP-like protein